jgi:hypothetical protein
VDVPPVAHDALSVRDVEVACHLVDQHLAANGAALLSTKIGEVLGPIVQALGGVSLDLVDAPLFALVCLDQLVAGVAAPADRGSQILLV